MSQPEIVAVRGAAFALELDARYAINIRRVAFKFSIKKVDIGLAKDMNTLDSASAGNYWERAAVV